jgi:hypothetical protein
VVFVPIPVHSPYEWNALKKEQCFYRTSITSWKGGETMKAGIIFTGTGPILILTSYESFEDPKLLAKLEVKGIKKFIASELPLERVREQYGNQYQVVMGDLYQTDDLRVLDYNGYNVFHSFSFKEMGKPLYHEG